VQGGNYYLYLVVPFSSDSLGYDCDFDCGAPSSDPPSVNPVPLETDLLGRAGAVPYLYIVHGKKHNNSDSQSN